jgi:hypothetical protein
VPIDRFFPDISDFDWTWINMILRK